MCKASKQGYRGEASGETRVDPPGTVHYRYTMHDGTFKGQDPRDLVRQAIQWWESEL